MKKLIKYIINGIVQGVGFRPYIYNTANKFNLTGIVYNDVNGVVIEVEGTIKELKKFENYFNKNLPPRARIYSITKKELTLKNYTNFIISASHKKGHKNTFIPPDSSLCKNCIKDLKKFNRRKNYPFTNCVDCGPRFSITSQIPFDRENTMMKKFVMCDDCQKEYSNPDNRRFHSQTNCCKKCGPELILLNNNLKVIKLKNDFEKIKFIADKILKNKIAAIKGIGGFHIASSPFDDKLVQKLRRKKIRDDKPLALMAFDINTIKKYAYLNGEQIKLLKFSQAPIVILKRKKNIKISRYVYSDLNTLGFMLPYTPLHYILLQIVNMPLIMTSGNISSEPIIKDNTEVTEKLKKVVDYFLLNNRAIFLNCDDSVVSFLYNNKIIIRRSRGFVPVPIYLNKSAKKDILSLGPEEKNTFSIVKKNELIISHHIGDLENYETFNSFKKNINKYLKIYEVNPKIIVADKHPDYLSTKYSKKLSGKKIFVQHHYAHALSLILDNNLDYKEKIICFAFDGTGYGDDGNIWGGEILSANCFTYERIGHLENMPLVTPEKAIKEPERIAVSYLMNLFNEIPEFLKNKFQDNIFEIIKYQLKNKKFVLTSSMGRLFDFIAYIIGVNDLPTYSGQLPVELENMSSSTSIKNYKYDLNYDNDVLNIKLKLLIQEILNDIHKKKNKSLIAKKFHNTLADIVFESSKLLKEKYKINKIGFTGGVFQNQLLIKLIKEKFKNKKFNLLFHKKIPPNDGGISAGQALFGVTRGRGETEREEGRGKTAPDGR